MTVAIGAVTHVLLRFCVLNIVLLARKFIRGSFTHVDIVDIAGIDNIEMLCYLLHQ